VTPQAWEGEKPGRKGLPPWGMFRNKKKVNGKHVPSKDTVGGQKGFKEERQVIAREAKKGVIEKK